MHGVRNAPCALCNAPRLEAHCRARKCEQAGRSASRHCNHHWLLCLSSGFGWGWLDNTVLAGQVDSGHVQFACLGHTFVWPRHGVVWCQGSLSDRVGLIGVESQQARVPSPVVLLHSGVKVVRSKSTAVGLTQGSLYVVGMYPRYQGLCTYATCCGPLTWNHNTRLVTVWASHAATAC
jgi:hypothetical protein